MLPLSLMEQRTVNMGLPLKLTNRNCRTQTHDEDALKFQKQRVGLKSAMLTDVRPIHDGRVSSL